MFSNQDLTGCTNEFIKCRKRLNSDLLPKGIEIIGLKPVESKSLFNSLAPLVFELNIQVRNSLASYQLQQLRLVNPGLWLEGRLGKPEVIGSNH